MERRRGKRKAADIAKRDVVHLLEGIVDRGAPAMANNCFQIVRKMFNWAVEKDILHHTPCTGVKLPSPKLEKQAALETWERKLISIVTGKGAGNVVSIATAKGKVRAAG